MNPHAIAIFGSAQARPGSIEFQQAEEIGQRLAQRGCILYCGGYGGLMEAVCKGASAAGGISHGIGLSGFDAAPNPYVADCIRHESLGSRLDAFSRECRIAIALPGGIGTLTEVFFFWNLGKTGLIKPPPHLLLFGPAWPPLLDMVEEHFAVSETVLSHIQCVQDIPALEQALNVRIPQRPLGHDRAGIP